MCAEWQALQRGPGDPGAATQGGFGGLSRRSGKKPIVAAVNGLAYGGGCEMIVNCDIVIASSRASFAFPEIKRGVTAIAGALPRVVRTIGRQRAMEMALTGRTLSAEEARDWGLVNEVVNVRDEIEANEKTVQRAVKVAEVIAGNSPDAVIVSREGIKLGWEGIGAEDGARLLLEVWGKRLDEGENIKEGLRAFVEKRVPSWVPSKL
jgi:enoyl-CoA hydratase/carnithine racemase